MDGRQQGISIGDLSMQTRVNIETIRYYEKISLLPAPGRTEGRHRVYGPAHVARLTFVRRSRELGFSLDEVRSLLRLVDGGHSSCSDVQAVTLKHLEDVRRKIADLERLERTLSEVASRCQGGSVPDCPIVEALYASPERDALLEGSPPERRLESTTAPGPRVPPGVRRAAPHIRSGTS